MLTFGRQMNCLNILQPTEIDSDRRSTIWKMVSITFVRNIFDGIFLRRYLIITWDVVSVSYFVEIPGYLSAGTLIIILYIPKLI